MHVKQNGSWCFHVTWRWCGGKVVWNEALSSFLCKLVYFGGVFPSGCSWTFASFLWQMPLLQSSCSWALCSQLQGESLKENVSRNYITEKQISFAAVKQKKKKREIVCWLNVLLKGCPSTLAVLLSFPRAWDAAAKWCKLFLQKQKVVFRCIPSFGSGFGADSRARSVRKQTKPQRPIKSLCSSNALLGKSIWMEMRCTGWIKKRINSQENMSHFCICMKRIVLGKTWLWGGGAVCLYHQSYLEFRFLVRFQIDSVPSKPVCSTVSTVGV